MIEPIRLAFDLVCAPEHAFEVWTGRTSLWWPRSHTVSSEDDLLVTFEPREGGRIFERTVGGNEHDWGRVLAWEPPRRLVYSWHLRVDAMDATEVEIRFLPADAGTRVEIEHRGWDRLGAIGPARRDGNQAGWGSLLPHYRVAVDTARSRDTSSP